MIRKSPRIAITVCRICSLTENLLVAPRSDTQHRGHRSSKLPGERLQLLGNLDFCCSPQGIAGLVADIRSCTPYTFLSFAGTYRGSCFVRLYGVVDRWICSNDLLRMVCQDVEMIVWSNSDFECRSWYVLQEINCRRLAFILLYAS
jgi:hypothetical protein